MNRIIRIRTYIRALFLCMGLVACTSDFEEINTNPNLITKEDASAKYFFVAPQVNLYGIERFAYWRAYILHADRYAGHFAVGHNRSWWGGELNYVYDPAYTDATWDWMGNYSGTLNTFLRLTAPDGDFPNEKMNAVGHILKGLYFQIYTDIFGELPYTEAGNADILLPAFDSQKTIYQGIIAELDAAMATIGDAGRTGEALEDLGENDILFGGDLQMWKKLANTLKLRIGIRALGAPGADFAEGAINEALNAPLLGPGENALLKKDPVIDQWASACYGDVWHNFPGGGEWKMTKVLIDYLRDNNDPRLEMYAQPAPGGTIEISRPEADEAALWQKRINFIISGLDDAGIPYTADVGADKATITMAENTYYIGAPARLRGEMNHYLAYELYSPPGKTVIQKKNEGQPISPELILTAGESFFLQAEAAVKGLGGGDAEALFQEGIRESMLVWNVDPGAIDEYLATSELATLSGSEEDKIRKIALQRWIANYTAGFEAWSVVRKTGYPEEVANGVAGKDPDIYGLGGINGDFPYRMQYGNSVKNTNLENLQEAIARQGPDVQNVKLWWAK